MKTRMILSLLWILSISASAFAQEADSLMKQVLENNRLLVAAREAYQVALLEAGIGNTPPDPEVEFGYLFGKPADLGHRIDFGVSQQVDFPTAYVHRSTIRKIRNSKADLEYQLIRQQVLTEARQLWIEQLHLNQLQELQQLRLESAKSVQSHVEQKTRVGEVSPLEFSQAKLMLASTEGEHEELLTLLHNNELALNEISGGSRVLISQGDFPQPSTINEDTLLAAYLRGPGIQLYEFELQQKEAQKSLALSEHLPKLSAGYFSETVNASGYRGLKLGISLPLWEKARTVKKAKTDIMYADAELNRIIHNQEMEIRQKLKEREMLRKRVLSLEEALSFINSLELLTISMENGEISLTEYFYSSDYFFRNQQLLLRYKRDLLALEADLLKIYF